MGYFMGENILVCASSNAALDEILSRILAKGLIGLNIGRGKEGGYYSNLSELNL